MVSGLVVATGPARTADAADSTAWLDQTYGTGGVATPPSVTVTSPSQEYRATAVLTLADGRQVVAGGAVNLTTPTGPCGSWVLTRLLSDGTPDPTFAGTGSRTLPPSMCSPFGANLPVALAVQSTGAVLVGGSQGTYLRVLADGTVDTAFGTRSLTSGTCNSGRTRLNPSVTGITVDASDRILVTGQQTVNVASGGCPFTTGSPAGIALRAAVVLLGPTGLAVPDPAPRPWAVTESRASGAWPTSTGFVVQVGSSAYWWGPTLLPAFGPLGQAIAVDADGRLAAVRYDGAAPPTLSLARDGVADATFNGGSAVTLPAAADLRPNATVWRAAVALPPGGGPLVVASPGPGALVVVRYTQAGVLDPAFGTGGVVELTVRRNGFRQDLRPTVALAGDGSVVIGLSAGRSVVLGSDGTAGAVRGGADFTQPVPCTSCTSQQVTVPLLGLPDGSALLRSRDARILRWLPDGSGVDPAFGTAGQLPAVLPGTRLDTVHRLAGGGLLAVAVSTTDVGLAMARYDGSGVPDPAFGTAGVTIVDDGTVRTGPSGRILVLGATALTRYTPDGLPDATFGTGGQVPVTAFEAVDVAGGILAVTASGLVRIDDSGTVTVLDATSGRLWSDGRDGALYLTSPTTVRRYLADGSVDPAYGTAGSAAVPAAVTSLADASVTDPDRVTLYGATGNNLALLRLGASGTPDAGWANGGLLQVPFPPNGTSSPILWVSTDGSTTLYDGSTARRFVPVPTPDVTPPTVTITTPADGALLLSGNGTVFVEYSCSDDRSGVASCTGSLPTGALATGSALPFTPGTSTLTVDATDALGQTASRTSTYTVRDGIWLPAFSGSSNFGVSDTRPIGWDLSNVTSTGALLMVEEPVNAATPGAATISMQLRTQFPASTAADPMRLELTVSTGGLAELGATPATLRVYRDGAPVAACTDATAAVPDPCLAETLTLAGGEARFVVRTTVGGVWTFGVPTNAAPVTVFDVATTRPDTDVTIPVLANDSDPDGDPLSATSATTPAHGTATCSGTTCTYRSVAGYTGTDSFSYTADDGRGGTASGTVTVTVDDALGASANLANGGVVTTDPGTGATATDPVQASVTLPAGQGGVVSLVVRPTATTATGFGLLGQEVVISAPPAQDAARPLVLTFQLDASLLPQGVTAQNLTLFRNGVPVGPCTGAGADPTPCIPAGLGRLDLPGGDVRLTVYTVAASTWSTGLASPTASAGGPYTVNEGSSVALDASGSASPAGAALTYAWTPSTVTPATAARPTFTGVDDGVVPVQVRVSDGLTASTASSSVTVLNVAPTITPVLTAATLGTATRLTGTVVDPGIADTHTVTVDWGDGSRGPVALTGRSLDVRHTYAAIGTYTVRVTVTDDDAGTSAVTRATTVTWPFSWVGLQAPPTVNAVRTGLLSVSFGLGGNRGTNVLSGPVTTIRVNCSTGATSGSASTLSGVLALVRTTYSYIGAAPSSWAGTCRDLRLPLRDGTTQTVRLSFR